MLKIKINCFCKNKRSKVKITCFYRNKHWRLKFDETMTIYDVRDYMVQKKYIPIGLFVRQMEASPIYPKIYDGAKLLFYVPSTETTKTNDVIPCLYGCPTAKDRPGNVPACMLTTFDGLILSKY